MGINLSELSRKSGVAYSALYDSLGEKGVCFVLHINPMDFASDKGA